ncbi:ABC transporter permease [Mycobacterium sp. PS03-16]|uniref:ABC transporter permease n=1 Tax=Mycobacterium sp. PS03-16 TaxID=2559611 RepID=UPI001431508D|nr:ABC transporter permease [Mycobacterium sp. PS03-16]
MTALSALTERMLLGTLRDLDLPMAIIVPVVTFVGFNAVLRHMIDTGGMSYPQYVLPVVVVQAMLLGALTTADRAARDQWAFGVRLRTMPISAFTPLAARMSYCLLRGVLAIAASLAVAYPFGFRMSGGPGYAVAFVVMALALTLALSMGADATGTRIKRGEASSQLLLVPQLLLVVLSTGLAPADSFPDWLHGFVTYQPVSQITETLRGFALGEVDAANLTASVAWCLGLLVLFGAIALRMQRRPE